MQNQDNTAKETDFSTPPPIETPEPYIIGGESPDNRFSTQQNGKTEQR